MLRRLRSKLLTLGVSLVVATQLGTLVSLLINVDRDAAINASANLDTGDARLNEFMRQRSAGLRDALRAVATDRKFIGAFAARDMQKITAVLGRHADRLEADFAVLIDQQGAILTAAGRQLPASMSFPELPARVSDDGVNRSGRELDGIVYEMLTIPVTDHRPSAWISLALPIDADLAGQLKNQTGLEISLFTRTNDTTDLIATSLTGSGKTVKSADIGAEFADLDLQSPHSGTLKIANQTFVSRQRPFIHGSEQAIILLKEPVAAATVPYDAVRKFTIALGLIALLIAMLGATALSREVTRALLRLTTSIRRIGAGEYGETIQADESQELADLAAAVNAMQTDVAKREELLTYEAQFDRITGLPNRYQASQYLEHSIQCLGASNKPLSVMIVGLNCLQEISASFGRTISDAMLVQAAEELRATVGREHTLARLNGDDFLIIMEGIMPAVAAKTAGNLLQSIGAGLSVRGVNIGIDASVGICAFPDAGMDADQLLLHAAVAKTDAQHTPDRICLYHEGREDRHVRQLTLLNDLKRAIQNDELKLYLQPKVKLADGDVCGAEALARWDHPVLGFLPPRDFISIAEQSGNLSLISHWAIEAAIRECRLWIEDGLDLPVSVNLNGNDLRDPQLTPYILDSLRDHDLDPRYLTIEISETALIQNFEQAAGVMQSLQDTGIRISIDDFGTGQSSLMRLKLLPADELQIARSFVKELPDNLKDVVIVRTAIDLAHRMNLQVSAKGLESRPAMSWLAEHGCEIAQGFFISRPMPAETFSQWVSHYNVDVTAYVSVLEAISP